MDYGEVLRRAWEIIWKHKVLWIFGILASCGNGGGGGGGNSGYQFSGEEFPELERFFRNVQDWQIALFVGLVSLFVIFMIALVALLSTIGRIGLIRGTLEAEQGTEIISLGYLFNNTLPYFWRVLLLSILYIVAGLAVVFLLILLSIPFAVITLGVGVVCLVCLLIPLGALISVFTEQTYIALIVEDLGIPDALRRGWEVFTENLGTMIIMGLILTIGSLLVSLLFAAPLVAVALPTLSGVLIGGDRAIGGGIIVSVLCFLAYLPVLIVLGGILRAYVGSAWTLTYLRLTSFGLGEPEELPATAS